MNTRNGLTILVIAFAGFALSSSPASAKESKAGDGLVWVFYNDAKMTEPVSVGVDARIDIDTGTKISDYGKVWRGRIKAPFSGEVEFEAEADNGLRLFIDEQPVIDGWSEDGERRGLFNFPESGKDHAFRLEYFQDGRVGFIRLRWKGKGHEQEIVPASAFFHTEADLALAEEATGDVIGVEKTPISREYARLYRDGQTPPREDPIRLGRGPHLFLDEYLIAGSQNLQRVVQKPERSPEIPNPIVTGKKDGCFQPYLTVLKDSETGKFRIWYGIHTADFDTNRSHIGYLESKDGIHWKRPHRVLKDPDVIQFGVAVVDDGPQFSNPEQRYKFAWYMDGGFKIATSPDGFGWTPIQKDPLIFHNHDITGLWFDPIRSRYLATLSVYRPAEDWEGLRRVTMHAQSEDLLDWTEPRYVILPDSNVDSGEMQFYAMDGYLARGDLVIGMVKVLRDDLKADNPPDPPEAYGVGYTSLAWTHDGETWYRDTEHFFDPHPKKGEWDHAHAWIDEQLPVGDEVFLYYGGYKSGHKVNRFEERQIGLVKMKRDRYVAREAMDAEGLLRTPMVILESNGLTLNVDASEGKALVQVTNAEGEPIPGFAFSDCKPITVDSLDAQVEWKRDLSELSGKEISLEISLKNARLFALGVE